MSRLIISLFTLVLFFSISSKVFGEPLFLEEGAEYDGEDYEGDDNYGVFKRARFWSPHPSDYNPMRRPGGQFPRNSKRDVTYHPLARIIAVKQRSMGIDDFGEDELNEYRQKKHVSNGGVLFYRKGNRHAGNLPVRRRQPQNQNQNESN